MCQASVITTGVAGGAQSQALVVYGGSSERAVPDGNNFDVYGWWTGGSSPDLWILCPEDDRLCVAPVLPKAEVDDLPLSSTALTAIGVLALLLFAVFVGLPVYVIYSRLRKVKI